MIVRLCAAALQNGCSLFVRGPRRRPTLLDQRTSREKSRKQMIPKTSRPLYEQAQFAGSLKFLPVTAKLCRMLVRIATFAVYQQSQLPGRPAPKTAPSPNARQALASRRSACLRSELVDAAPKPIRIWPAGDTEIQAASRVVMN